MTFSAAALLHHACQPRVNLGFAMADWFKFFNDTLDEPRVQFAIAEHPQVVSVMVLLLSEASKKRSARIPWSDENFELFSYSRKLNVTVPIINHCMGLLEKIGFINRETGWVIINPWDSMQSDYCKGLNRGYYRVTSETLASNSLDTSARGEERRSEKKKKTPRLLSGKASGGGDLGSLAVRVADRGGVREEELRDGVPPGTYSDRPIPTTQSNPLPDFLQ